jgi:hypothetical protein
MPHLITRGQHTFSVEYDGNAKKPGILDLGVQLLRFAPDEKKVVIDLSKQQGI